MNTTTKQKNKRERGAALVLALVVSLILSVVCISMLTAVGAGSRNSTDVLSETKAYYAAESGLQATVNILRNNDPAVAYSAAAADPDLSTWLAYNCTASDGTTSISIGLNPCNSNAGTSYSINVTDPDNTKDSTTFSTTGTFKVTNSVSIPASSISFPSAADANKVTLSIVNITNCAISWSSNNHCAPNANDPNPLLSTINIQTSGTGAQSAWSADISINYTIIDPRDGLRTVRGKIWRDAVSGGVPNPPVKIKFDNTSLMGSEIKLCQSTSATCSSFYIDNLILPTVPSITTVPVYMHTSALQPYRLKIEATGYGPNKAKKQLEAIVQKNFFNDSDSPSPFMMQGSSQGMVFNPGNSSVFSISGVDIESGVTAPSIGVTNQAALTTVLSGIPNNNNNINPAPAIVTDVPSWLATPQNLDALVSKLRTTAQNSGRYYLNPQQNLTNVGNVDGTGITFCEGDCTAAADGGGILVVTGQLRNLGGWDFKGLIIVTGADGWLRNGGGDGQVVGNVVIAPYTSADLSPNTFSLPPKYQVTGSGTSDISYDKIDLDQTFNGTTAITDFMLGVAEK